MTWPASALPSKNNNRQSLLSALYVLFKLSFRSVALTIIFVSRKNIYFDVTLSKMDTNYSLYSNICCTSLHIHSALILTTEIWHWLSCQFSFIISTINSPHSRQNGAWVSALCLGLVLSRHFLRHEQWYTKP